jgi:hypothetical protein
MARLVDILVVDVGAADSDVTILALEYAAPAARVLRLKNGAEALSCLFRLRSLRRMERQLVTSATEAC